MEHHFEAPKPQSRPSPTKDIALMEAFNLHVPDTIDLKSDEDQAPQRPLLPENPELDVAMFGF